MKERCPRCDLRFEKEEGGFLGAMTVNYGFAVGVWALMLGIVLALTVPDVPVAPLLVASLSVLIAVPLWFFPRSKGVWAGVEFMVARSDPDYRSPIVRDRWSKDLE